MRHPKHAFEGIRSRNPTKRFYALFLNSYEVYSKSIRLTGGSSLEELNRQGVPFFLAQKSQPVLWDDSSLEWKLCQQIIVFLHEEKLASRSRGAVVGFEEISHPCSSSWNRSFLDFSVFLRLIRVG